MKLNTIKDMCWARLLEVVGEPVLRELFFLSDMVACTNIRCRKRFEVTTLQSVAFLQSA